MKRTSRLARLFFEIPTLILLTAFGTPAFAGEADVTVNGFSFDPPDVTINVNEDVVWTWASDFHNSHSEDLIWDSGVQFTGFVYSFTFTNAGTYPYHCTIHGFG